MDSYRRELDTRHKRRTYIDYITTSHAIWKFSASNWFQETMDLVIFSEHDYMRAGEFFGGGAAMHAPPAVTVDGK